MNVNTQNSDLSPTSDMHKTRLDIKKDTRKKLITILNQQMVDTFDLYTQAKQAHWNVKGIHFLQIHELFDKVAQDVFPHIDTLAERVTTLGGVANGTARMVASTSRLEDFPEGSGSSEKFLRALADRFAHAAKTNRKALEECGDLGDPNSEDLLTALGNQLDESLWFIEAHLQKG